jgi:single-stranded DNA-specific DHH superfamily exonuclease
MNARDKVKDTIIGTVTSIISHSRIYKEGTVIVGMAYSQEKIKISARLCGENGRNVKEVLARVHSVIEGEIGGHSCAAGSLIKKEQEEKFIEQLKKVLELEVIKINQ